MAERLVAIEYASQIAWENQDVDRKIFCDERLESFEFCARFINILEVLFVERFLEEMEINRAYGKKDQVRDNANIFQRIIPKAYHLVQNQYHLNQ